MTDDLHGALGTAAGRRSASSSSTSSCAAAWSWYGRPPGWRGPRRADERQPGRRPTVLDELDPIPGRYTLEVSSPGVERSLRTPAHFARAVGRDGDGADAPRVPGSRRLTGRWWRPTTTASSWRCEEPPGGRSGSPTRTSTGPARCSPGAQPPPAPRGKAASRAARRRRRNDDGGEEKGHDAMSKTNFEFLDALGQIARDKGISVETLLDALANALVAAYKRRPDAAEEAVVTIDPESGRDPRLRPGARRGRQRRPRVGRHPRRLRPHRRPDGQAGHPPAHPRGRARPEVRGVRRAARATSSPASSSRPTTATRCSTWARWRRCCPRPSRSPTSATSTAPG